MADRKPVFEEFASATINLYLKVGGPRADGMHPLESLAVFADIGDRIWISPGAGVSLAISGPYARGLDSEPDNIVLRAARLLAEAFGVPADHGAAIVLEKNLPVASGIGGGSADAAAALRALARLWNIPKNSDLTAIARTLGSDVPACLAGRPVLMRGAGEIIAPALAPRLGVLLANDGEPVSTPAVYRRFDALSLGADFAEAPPPGGKDAANFIAGLRALPNDLEAAAFDLSPGVSKLKRKVAALPGCALARMSGSGGTVFGLFETFAAAAAARILLARENPALWVAAGSTQSAAQT
ncbi:MAG: 4-(cytidine 5'-diphospho)-2-C-methyl-D-erythritol kinase [Caulobacterales bacterium]